MSWATTSGRLGSAYLDTIIQNPYLAAIGERMVQYAGTINGALSDINDSYRILGQNALTGLLLVGTRLDDAGNAIRDVAHKVGGFFTDILRGLGIDGYISGATVFADANFNGVLDAGELSTTTDANGRYAIAVERRAAGPAGRLRHRHEPGFHRHRCRRRRARPRSRR